MNVLDNLETIKKYNPSKSVESIDSLPDQLNRSWQGARGIKMPKNYRKVKNVIVCGMGGSNLASELIRSIYKGQINLPFVLVRGYDLPKFANKDSLVLVVSYSGNTEETVSCLKQAVVRKTKTFCLASGGNVISLAKKNKLPFYQISRKLNPSGQPRYGLGSQLGAMLAILNKLRIIKVDKKDIEDTIDYLEIVNKLFATERSSGKNLAKSMAKDFFGFTPFIVSADFLAANSHILANQINESAKNLAVPYLIPELNHHLMEGLALPLTVTGKVKFLFFSSEQYPALIRKRFAVTQKVLKKQKISFAEYSINGDSRMMAALEILLFGSWFSFYLAVLNKQKPAQIPWVDYFKAEMKK